MCRNALYSLYLIALSVGLYLTFCQFKYAIFLLLVLMSNVFGFFSATELPHIRTPFGSFWIKDIAFLMVMLPLLLGLFDRKIPSEKNILSLPIILLLVLMLVQILRAYVLLHEDIHYILRLARPFSYYALFFVLCYRSNHHKLVNFLVNTVLFIGLVSALVGITQVIFEFSLGGSKIEITEYGYARTYQPNVLFVLFGFFILLSKGQETRNSKLKLFSSIYYIITITFILFTLSRGLWFVFCLSLIGFYMFGEDRIRFFKHAFMSCIILFLVFATAPSVIRPLSDVVLTRAQSGWYDLIYRKGTFAKRMDILGYSWDYVKKYNILLGVGFKYGRIRGETEREPTSITIQSDPYRWVGTDIGSAYILFRHGIMGILLLLLLYYKLFKKGIYFYSRTVDTNSKGLMKAILIISIVAVSLSVISQPFTSPEMLIVVLLSWFMFECIQKEAKV